MCKLNTLKLTGKILFIIFYQKDKFSQQPEILFPLPGITVYVQH